MAERREKNGRAYRKIVITGGPCAGKTTGMTWIQTTFEKMGYTVLFLSEPATEMMTAGITPGRCSTPMAYQQFQMKLQFEKEKVFERAAEDIAGGDRILHKVLIVCDRGFMDNRAYMTEGEFDQVVRDLGTGREELLDSYDGIFHLETAAKNALAFYGNANNAVRSETPEQARALDDRLLEVWAEHPRHYVIENLGGFEEKMRHLIAEIAACLGEQQPPEIRRRFLIDYPDPEALKKLADSTVTECDINQVYLRAPENEEVRVRRQTTGGQDTFYLTRKGITGGRRYLKSERRLSGREYDDYCKSADPGAGEIRKKRFYLAWKGEGLAVDLYPFWEDRALLEVSLESETQTVEIPDCLRIREEVTGDERYEVHSLAREYGHCGPAPAAPAQD